MPESQDQKEEASIDSAGERTQPALLFPIFIGPSGLRAGWALLLFVVIQECLRFLIFPAVQWLFSPSLKAGQPMRVGSVLCYEGAALLCVWLATWAMALIEHRRPWDYGLRARHAAPRFAAGFASGFALLTALLLWLRWRGLLVITGHELSPAAAVRYGLVWLLAFLLVAIFEEYSFRGYIQFTLARGLGAAAQSVGLPETAGTGFWTAAVLTSCYFGSVHMSNSGESSIGLIAAGLIGIVFCLSLWRTGSLWWAIGFHAAWDWAQSFLYGVGDSGNTIAGQWLVSRPAGPALLSGGTTGPEGSVFVLPIVALAACTALLLPRNRTPAPAAPPDSASDA